MSKGIIAPSFEGEQIYTLAQSGTKENYTPIHRTEITVNGKGTELNNDEVLRRRTKKKTITQTVALSLIKVCDKKGNPERKQFYWNTYHCQNRIVSAKGKLYGNYCKNRFCTVCCGIRKAELINKYYPIISKWEEPYFVTLTAKAVYAKDLNKRIYNMLRAFKILINRNKKRSQRGKGIKLMGVKSLECNFNPVAKTYNPHFHLIVPNKTIADILVKEWLALWTNKFTYSKAQDARKVENLETTLIEIIKYGSKIFTEPDMNKPKNKTSPYIYVSALDNILCAMKGHRIFERFGFNLPKSEKKEKQTAHINKYDEWEFDINQCDWINPQSKELLTNYTLPPELKALLANNINTDLE